MQLSVIFSTWNQPEWLEKVLLGYAASTFREFEIVIADDGSDERTRACIERLRPVVRVPVKHVWHEHEGFRKTVILNRAIAASEGDYLVFSDGDCIPRRDFLAVHARYAQRGRFLSGGYLKLPMDTSRAIGAAEIASGEAFSTRWLRAHGAPLTKRLLRLSLSPAAASFCDALTPTRPTFNGHNASAWRRDVVAANGFDERMQWGGLDRELGERLENAGVRGLQLRHRAHVLHLDHSRGYRRSELVARNLEIRRETRRLGLTRTPAGLDGDTVTA